MKNESVRKTMNISVPEWWAALSKRSRQNPQGMTADEMAESMGCCMRTLRSRMKVAFRQGKIKMVGRRMQTCVDGIERPIPVYKLEK